MSRQKHPEEETTTLSHKAEHSRVGSAVDPLLKWPGGKRWLVDKVAPAMLDLKGRYYEPFFGGGAVYFALQPRVATLSDSNEELINAYQQIRDRPVELIQKIKAFKNSSTCYYKVRSSCPRSPLSRAARLLYLMRLSFNGIHRVNLKGQFNVPYGHKNHLSVCDEERIHLLSAALQSATLLVADFEAATEGAIKGDTVYFDPPYTVAHGNNGFIKYNERIFSWDDQVRLAAHARKLANRGVRVVISNADHSSIRQLYADFERKTVTRFSRIAAESKYRRKISELLLCKGVEH